MGGSLGPTELSFSDYSSWGSEMSGEEEEDSLDSMGVSYDILKKRLRDDWTGPDFVYTTVYSWITDCTAHSGKSAISSTIASLSSPKTTRRTMSSSCGS